MSFCVPSYDKITILGLRNPISRIKKSLFDERFEPQYGFAEDLYEM
jgi:hypothetical protein